jgi:hypothetical protein
VVDVVAVAVSDSQHYKGEQLMDSNKWYQVDFSIAVQVRASSQEEAWELAWDYFAANKKDMDCSDFIASEPVQVKDN